MRRATIHIVDKIRNIEKITEYKFFKVSTYKTLINEMNKLYTDFEKKDKITIRFICESNKNIITDLSKYILPHDIIEVEIDQKTIDINETIYFLCDGKSGSSIRSSYSIKELYLWYSLFVKESDSEFLILRQINNKLILIDVLDTPKRHYNECLNRLIHRYNF